MSLEKLSAVAAKQLGLVTRSDTARLHSVTINCAGSCGEASSNG